MNLNGKSISSIVCILFLSLIFPAGAGAQIQEIDTSDYLPLFYPSALEYNLMIASSKGYISEIDRLINQGADINAQTGEGASPLIFAVTNGQTEAVKRLLEYKPELNNRTIGFETALLIAVKAENFEISEALIRAGADMSAGDFHKATPLHYAVLYGYPDITDLLLYYGAPQDTAADDGTTPLITAVRAGHADIADILIQNNADVNIADNEGFNPFMIAAYYGDTLMMDLLYRNGANIYAVNNQNHNALTLAIAGNHRESVEYLLRIGDKWAGIKNALDPYDVVSRYRRKEIEDILRKNSFPGNVSHVIDELTTGVSIRTGGNDFFSSLSLSFREPYINAGVFTALDFKPIPTKVLIKASETSIYQYFDRGSVIQAGVFKDFTVSDNPEKVNILFSPSLAAGYAFANKLKGSSVTTKGKFLVIPAVSFKFSKGDFSFNLGAEYQKSSYYKNGPLWLRMGISYNYYFDRTSRIKLKPLKWQ